jgi:UDP-N-acetylglucosamine 2-epimerase (non-hydrolysing)
MKILHVVGARPNFMKIAPVVLEMSRFPDQFKQTLVHTGQHYDPNMSQIFFKDLGIPEPDTDLGVGSGTHAEQTAEVMKRFEPLLARHEPDWVLVVGDVNSTLASALVCAKAGVPVAHVEAGLRSFDRSMPEEINRLLTDQIADLLFTHSPEAETNLVAEGIAPQKIRFVGNVMIDTLVRLLPRAEALFPALKARLVDRPYVLVTLHRPSNVDEPERLARILEALIEISEDADVLFPVHPRTKMRIEESQPALPAGRIKLLEPLGYLEFVALEAHAVLVITDSGGVQEETTYLKIPCLTLRPNTERPVTISKGTNRLVEQPEDLYQAVRDSLERKSVPENPPALWDGRAAARIVDVFRSLGNS